MRISIKKFFMKSLVFGATCAVLAWCSSSGWGNKHVSDVTQFEFDTTKGTYNVACDDQYSQIQDTAFTVAQGITACIWQEEVSQIQTTTWSCYLRNSEDFWNTISQTPVSLWDTKTEQLNYEFSSRSAPVFTDKNGDESYGRKYKLAANTLNGNLEEMVIYQDGEAPHFLDIAQSQFLSFANCILAHKVDNN